MATLNTNATQLQQLDRRRELASALQQSGSSIAPITHVNQGLAKLMQALAANAINKRADKDEQSIAEKRRKAIAAALDPTIFDPDRRGDSEFLVSGAQPEGDVQGVDVHSFERLGSRRNKTGDEATEGLFAALSPDNAEAVIANILTQQLTGENDEDRFELVGKGNLIDMGDGTPPFEAQVVMTNGPDRQLGITDGRGGFTPLASNQIKGATQRTQDTPLALNKQDISAIQDEMIIAISALDELSRLKLVIDRGGLMEESTVGGIRKGMGSFIATIESLGETFTRRPDEDRISSPQLQADGTLGYTFQTASADYNSAAHQAAIKTGNARQYSKREIALNKEFFNRFSKLDGATQQLSISIAYTLARIADPGGRLSEMDVLNQMRGLGLDSANKDRRLSAISQAERTFAVKANAQLFFAKKRAKESGVELPIPPGFEENIRAILDRPPFGTPVEETSLAQPLSQQQVIDRIRSMSPEERRTLEVQQGLEHGSLDRL